MNAGDVASRLPRLQSHGSSRARAPGGAIAAHALAPSLQNRKWPDRHVADRVRHGTGSAGATRPPPAPYSRASASSDKETPSTVSRPAACASPSDRAMSRATREMPPRPGASRSQPNNILTGRERFTVCKWQAGAMALLPWEHFPSITQGRLGTLGRIRRRRVGPHSGGMSPSAHDPFSPTVWRAHSQEPICSPCQHQSHD